MTFAVAYLVAGVLLLGMAVIGPRLHRLPISTAMLYLGAGALLGPAVLGLIDLDPLTDPKLLEHITEVVVIVSLFTAGLKLRVSLRDARWLLPLRLAVLSMALTVGLVAAIGVAGLGLSWGAAILLGAILAPTDPVLASDVQTAHPNDHDRLRFTLTGEAGLNDGSAFPFVMLGLGLLGLHELGETGWRWVAVDVVWATAAGLGVGLVLGTLTTRLLVYLRRRRETVTGLDDFVALGLIAGSYGATLLVHGYGFLAVFAAGLALRRVERKEHAATEAEEAEARGDEMADEPEEMPELGEEHAEDQRFVPGFMAQAVLAFNEQLERIGELMVVVLIGGLLTRQYLVEDAIWFVPLLFLVLRPLAVLVGMVGSETGPIQRGLVAWFGVRGVGSIFYLAYALSHGLTGDDAELLTSLTLCTVAASILVHGVTVTPLMSRYHERMEHERSGGRRRRPRTASGAHG